MSKGRFLNQKLGKRTTRKIALLKSRIQDPRFKVQDKSGGGIQDSGFRIQGNFPTPSKSRKG